MLRTELAQKALINIEKYRDAVTPYQFEKATDMLKNFDSVLTGSGYPAMEAKEKLTQIGSVSRQDFILVMGFTFSNEAKS